MKKKIYIAVTFTFIIIFLTSIYLGHTELETKSELVKLVLEQRMKSDPVEGSLLVVETPLLSGLDLPQDVSGVHVVLITMEQLKASETNSVSIHAILFTEITLGVLSGHIEFLAYYNSYWPGWNGSGYFDFIGGWGTWLIYSKDFILLV